VYQYFDVPNDDYEALMNASSLGSYFYHNITSVPLKLKQF
ncbi:MAG: KTSC domain-containing protein, partial [Clostridiales bacterium]|nr:KTSC domain-containing protein [Clostridiales bacterium]